MRRLRRSKGRHALLEGPHLLEAALDAGLEPTSVLVTPEITASDTGARLLPRLPRSPVEAPARLLDPLMDADAPRGLLAVVDLPRSGVDTLPAPEDGRFLFLDGLQDPGNLGALARVAEAAGLTGLALGPGCASPNHPRALRASAGSLLRLPAAVRVSLDELDQHLAAAPRSWLALSPRDGTDLYDEALREVLHGSWVLMVGAEGPGLSPAAEARADLRITIPMAPAVESLNAAVAAALVVFEAGRRTRTASA